MITDHDQLIAFGIDAFILIGSTVIFLLTTLVVGQFGRKS